MERKLLKVQEVADRLGICRSKAYMLVAGGEIPSVRIGRNRRIASDALDRYIARLVEGAEDASKNTDY